MGNEPTQLTLIADVERILRAPRSLPEGVTARATVPSDEAALARLYFEAYPRAHCPTMADAEHELRITFQGEYGELDLRASPVVIADDTIACSAMTVFGGPWDDVPPGPFLIEMMVHPDHRRRGLAAFAIQEAARRIAGGTIALRVMSDNPSARALYEHLGFQPVDIT